MIFLNIYLKISFLRLPSHDITLGLLKTITVSQNSIYFDVRFVKDFLRFSIDLSMELRVFLELSEGEAGLGWGKFNLIISTNSDVLPKIGCTEISKKCKTHPK